MPTFLKRFLLGFIIILLGGIALSGNLAVGELAFWAALAVLVGNGFIVWWPKNWWPK